MATVCIAGLEDSEVVRLEEVARHAGQSLTAYLRERLRDLAVSDDIAEVTLLEGVVGVTAGGGRVYIRRLWQRVYGRAEYLAAAEQRTRFQQALALARQGSAAGRLEWSPVADLLAQDGMFIVFYEPAWREAQGGANLPPAPVVTVG